MPSYYGDKWKKNALNLSPLLTIGSIFEFLTEVIPKHVKRQKEKKKRKKDPCLVPPVIFQYLQKITWSSFPGVLGFQTHESMGSISSSSTYSIIITFNE